MTPHVFLLIGWLVDRSVVPWSFVWLISMLVIIPATVSYTSMLPSESEHLLYQLFYVRLLDCWSVGCFVIFPKKSGQSYYFWSKVFWFQVGPSATTQTADAATAAMADKPSVKNQLIAAGIVSGVATLTIGSYSCPLNDCMSIKQYLIKSFNGIWIFLKLWL